MPDFSKTQKLTMKYLAKRSIIVKNPGDTDGVESKQTKKSALKKARSKEQRPTHKH